MANRTMAIPTIGQVLTLGKDWTFTCVSEYRNQALMDYLEASGVIGPDAPRYIVPPLCGQIIPPSAVIPERALGHHAAYQIWPNPMPCQRALGHDGECARIAHLHREYMRYACTLPRGTRLRVDRIYIRKGASTYDSLTFWALDLATAKKAGARKAVRFWAKLAEVNTMVVTDKLTSPKPMKVKLPPIRAIILRE